MRNKIRMTTAAITVALALGVAAPAASAVEMGHTQTTASAQLATAGVRDSGTLSLVATAGQNAASTPPGATTPGGVEAQSLGSAARTLVNKIVDSRYGQAAINAAKRGETPSRTGLTAFPTSTR